MGKPFNKKQVKHTLEIPQYDANQHWLKTAFDIIESMTRVASTLESYDDIKFNILTSMLIETILNPELKDKIAEQRKQDIEDLEGKGLSTDDMNRAIMDLNIKLFGQWFQHAKKYMTLEEKLEVFRTAPDV